MSGSDATGFVRACALADIPEKIMEE